MQQLIDFERYLEQSIKSGTFVKLSMGNYKGNDLELKRISINLIPVKGSMLLSFTYRNKTNDIVKNYQIGEGIAKAVDLLCNGFSIATLFTTSQETIAEYSRNGVLKFRARPIQLEKPHLKHDKQKNRLISQTDARYLFHLGISDVDGRVFDRREDKFKQINHYIELLAPMLSNLPKGKCLKVVDMGSGKGYLTFALYDYLSKQGFEANVTGVEFRKGLVEKCNDIASLCQFAGLHFVEGNIADFDAKDVDLLIALHACDTATDDAIAKGINAGARQIVVAPCCHKQVRLEMEKNRTKNELSFLTTHGIFLERQAEMATDGIRALVLKYFGYKTKVMQFIADAHTPKNVMIVGERIKEQEKCNKAQLLSQLQSSKAFLGINQHYLETVVAFN